MKNSKDFDRWNDKKKIVDVSDHLPLFHEREVWWCSIGINVGVEMNGQNEEFERPVLILKKFNKDMAIVAPLTRSLKNTPYHYELETEDGKSSVVVLSQLRLVSGKRFLRLMKKIPENTFNKIIERVNLYFINKSAPSRDGASGA